MPQLNLFFVSINSITTLVASTMHTRVRILSGAYNTHYAYAQTQAHNSPLTVQLWSHLHVENHVEIFWTFAEIVHNDQTHPFGKNYVRMMRKTFCMCPFGRFWIKSLKEKLWSKKYFFYIRFRCPRCFSDICSHLPHLLFLIFRSRSIDIPTWWLGYGWVEEEEARTKRIIRQLSNTGGEKVEDI